MLYRYIKPVLDAFVAIVLLFLLFPLLVVILISSGIFTQQRLGRDARPFTIFKFKTMLPVSESLKKDKDRLTSLGKILRNWSLDELPQLINVLKGDMSLIGPRPLPVRYDPLIKGHYRLRFTVKPGITGLAQVKGRNMLDWRQKFELDKEYAENISLSNDLKILVLTFGAVVFARGVDADSNTTMNEFKGFDE